jgi:hypothetical protein
MVISQQAAQPLAALNMPVAAGVCPPREQQDIALPLVIPFGMEMFDIFTQRSPPKRITLHRYSSFTDRRPRQNHRPLSDKGTKC